MKEFFYVLLVIHSIGLTDQSNDDDYEVVCEILNMVDSIVGFEYYYPSTPRSESIEEYRKYPDSMFMRFNVESYEEIYKSGSEWDSILTKEFIAESKLFQARLNRERSVILIGRIRSAGLKKEYSAERDSLHYDEIKSLQIDIRELEPLNLKVELFSCGDYSYKEINERTLQRDKYLIKAFFGFSNVIYNSEKTSALVQFWYHHKIDNGTTGHGMYALLKKEDYRWKVYKLLVLWEE